MSAVMWILFKVAESERAVSHSKREDQRSAGVPLRSSVVTVLEIARVVIFFFFSK